MDLPAAFMIYHLAGGQLCTALTFCLSNLEALSTTHNGHVPDGLHTRGGTLWQMHGASAQLAPFKRMLRCLLSSAQILPMS